MSSFCFIFQNLLKVFRNILSLVKYIPDKMLNRAISKMQRETLKKNIRHLARKLYDADRIRFTIYDSISDMSADFSRTTTKKLKERYEQLKEYDLQEIKMTKGKKPFKLSLKKLKKIELPKPKTVYIIGYIPYTDNYSNRKGSYSYTDTKYAQVQVDGRNDASKIQDVENELIDEVYFSTPNTEVNRNIHYDRIVWKTMNKEQFAKENVSLQYVRMYRAHPIKYNFLDAKTNESLENTCVIDYLVAKYSETKGLKKIMTRDKLNDYFTKMIIEHGQSCETLSNLDFKIACQKPFDGGVSTYMLRVMCEDLNIPLYALDIDNKVFEKLNADPNKNTYPAIMYYTMDNHMYPIDNNKVRQSIIKSHAERDIIASFKSSTDGDNKEGLNKAQIDLFSRDIIENADINDVTDTKTNVNVFYDDNLKDKLLELFKKNNTIYKCSLSQGKICAIYDVADGVNLFHNPHYKQSKFICETLDIPFRNQSMGQLCNEIMKMTLQPLPVATSKVGFNDESFDSKTLSSFNKEVFNIMNGDDIRNVAFTDFYDFIDENDIGFVQAFDCRRCYRNCLYNNTKYKLPIFSVFDTPKLFQLGTPLSPGFYFVKSQNYFPLRGDGWYATPTIDYVLSQGIIKEEDIKYELCSSSSLKPSYFNKFIDHVEEKLPTDISKMVINAMTGVLGMKTIKQERAYFTKSKNDVARYLFTFGKDAHVSIVNENEEEQPLYQIIIKSMFHIEESNLPIYNYIIEMGNIELHKLYNLVKTPTSKLIGFKTDCVVMQYDKPIDFNLDDNKYKLDSPPTFDRLRNKEPRTATYTIPTIEWSCIFDDTNDFTIKAKEIVNLESSINIDGYAGCGKTTLIKAIKKELDKREMKYICLAPTNKACRHIDGKTLHKFFGIACNNKKPNLKGLLQHVNYIFIDEISMVKSVFYKMFLTLKKNNPHLKFIIAGDFHQLPPVNDGDFEYADSYALHSLCDGCKLQLTKCRRSDDVMFNLCLSVLEGKEIQHHFGKRSTYKNVCFTNRMRKHINKVCMSKWISEFKPKKVIHLSKNADDDQSQDMMLSVGMPIIANQASSGDKGLGVVNNETFDIIELNENDVVIQAVPTSEPITISHAQFVKSFYLAFAITCHKAQGDTFDEPYTIYEWARFPNVNMKYVALSRSSNKDHVNFSDFKLARDTFSTGHVYKIINEVDNEVYVGSTIKPIEKRFTEHKKGGLHCHEHFARVGWDNCRIELIEKLEHITLHDLHTRETFWINEIGTLNRCTPN